MDVAKNRQWRGRTFGALLTLLLLNHCGCADIFLAINPPTSQSQVCSGLFIADEVEMCRRTADGALGAYDVFIPNLIVDDVGQVILNDSLVVGFAEITQGFRDGDELETVYWQLKAPDNTLLNLTALAEQPDVAAALTLGDVEVAATLQFILNFERDYRQTLRTLLAEEAGMTYGIDNFFECINSRPADRDVLCSQLYDDDHNGTINTDDYHSLIELVEGPDAADAINSVEFELDQYYACSEADFNDDDSLPITPICRPFDRNNDGQVNGLDLILLFDSGEETPTDNTSPVAIAGADQTVQSGESVVLDGSESFDSETAVVNLNYQWDQVLGIQVTIIDELQSIAQITAPNVSQTTKFQFRITITDESGLSDSDTIQITVQPKGPVADAGDDDQVSSGDFVRLDATESTGNDLSYEWSQVSGPTVDLSSVTTAQPLFTAPSVDSLTVLTFQVTVTDGNNLSDVDTVDVTIIPGESESVIADAGVDQQAQSEALVTLDGTNSEGTDLSYFWEQVPVEGDQDVTLSSVSTVSPVFVAPALLSTDDPILLRFRVTVTDGSGLQDTDEVDITILPPSE
ncbi:MAG: hypothetical protein HJJLKODD_02892 [Phycisphaerae bacterium]|nr:hypothetical protein [Phycisphaerae bacterium]